MQIWFCKGRSDDITTNRKKKGLGGPEFRNTLVNSIRSNSFNIFFLTRGGSSLKKLSQKRQKNEKSVKTANQWQEFYNQSILQYDLYIFPRFFFSVDQSWYVSKVLIVSNDPYESISGDRINRECHVFSFFFFEKLMWWVIFRGLFFSWNCNSRSPYYNLVYAWFTHNCHFTYHWGVQYQYLIVT